MEVLLPEKTSENTHELVPGVFINGTVGWIPITKMDQTECYIPYIYGKLAPFQLNPFHIGFKPFQVINGAIQLRIGVQGLPITSALAHPADTDSLGFKCPSTLKVWEGRIIITQNQLDQGFLLGKNVMMKCEGGWYRAKVYKFLKPFERGDDKFNYQMKYQSGRQKYFNVHFRVPKYGFGDKSPRETWCLLVDV